MILYLDVYNTGMEQSLGNKHIRCSNVWFNSQQNVHISWLASRANAVQMYKQKIEMNIVQWGSGR